jgi:hypothetical protein
VTKLEELMLLVDDVYARKNGAYAAVQAALEASLNQKDPKIAELERLCDATYVAQGADAYNHACDVMERWQAERAAAGKEVGTTGSLCDGIAWLYGRLDELEAALNSNESAYQRGYMDGRSKPVEAALKPGEPVAWRDKYGVIYEQVEIVLPTDTPLYAAHPAQTPEVTHDVLISKLCNVRMMASSRLPKEHCHTIDEAIGALATPPAQTPLNDDLRDRLVAISAAIAGQDDRAAQAMISEILKAPSAPSQQEES